MAQDVFNNSVHVNGALSCREFNAPPGSISNDDIEAAAAIDATKVIHQFPLQVAQAPGTAVVAATTLLHVAHGAGEVVSLEAVTPTVATGADRTVTIDLQKSTGGAAFASISTLVLDDDNVARVPEAGTILTPTYVDGDVFQVVVAVAGAAGAQAQGLLITVNLREEPQ